ncbi:alpha/beta fold hydrolase [uncultured Olsenella sp.]|uniref:alpha/beta fold hydrolase n=1 Tax=uncultured Olsenella sp. TaxID=190764 RepID=UPI0026DBB40F|nr:alpha/beta fold hydrolase [uncultured Olsenella sp.]
MSNDAPALPERHVPRPYARPTAPLDRRLQVKTPDGARISAFCYAPAADAAVTANAATPGVLPVLMLHGNGEEHGIFGVLVDALVACGRPVVAVDSRAQGTSTRGTAQLTYELMADDALAVLDTAGLARVHVLGFSDGAIEGLLLARDHAERIASLTSVGANLSPEGIPGNDELAEAAGEWEAWATAGDESALYEDGTPAPSRRQATQMAELLRLMLVEPHIEAESLGRISCPCCVMAGELDQIPADETRLIARSIPGSRLAFVADADHTLPKVAPEAVLRELLVTIAEAEQGVDWSQFPRSVQRV